LVAKKFNWKYSFFKVVAIENNYFVWQPNIKQFFGHKDNFTRTSLNCVAGCLGNADAKEIYIRTVQLRVILLPEAKVYTHALAESNNT
jgi:hypothetical protein